VLPVGDRPSFSRSAPNGSIYHVTGAPFGYNFFQFFELAWRLRGVVDVGPVRTETNPDDCDSIYGIRRDVQPSAQGKSRDEFKTRFLPTCLS
jgi:hypothetical protein